MQFLPLALPELRKPRSGGRAQKGQERIEKCMFHRYVLGNDAKPPRPQPIDTKKMDTDTETTAKKYKASEIVAALENKEVECDSPHILLYVATNSCGSLCDLKQHNINTRKGLEMAMLQTGLVNLAAQAMRDEPEATAALGGAIARSTAELKKKILGAMLNMAGE